MFTIVFLPFFTYCTTVFPVELNGVYLSTQNYEQRHPSGPGYFTLNSNTAMNISLLSDECSSNTFAIVLSNLCRYYGDGGGGLIWQLCLTLATPWIVAC